MKKILSIAVLALAVSGCSTTKLAEVDPVSKDAVKYTQDFGKVEVTFNDDTWTEIKSTATAAIPINDDAGLEQAMNIATMRAKRNIVEFMNTDLKNNKTVDVITNSLAKEVSDNDQKSKERAANIATKVTEKMVEESNGIVRGSYIKERKISSDTRVVSVTVQVDKKSIRAASQIRASMGQ
jgi:hypothetical protein